MLYKYLYKQIFFINTTMFLHIATILELTIIYLHCNTIFPGSIIFTTIRKK